MQTIYWAKVAIISPLIHLPQTYFFADQNERDTFVAKFGEMELGKTNSHGFHEILLAEQALEKCQRLSDGK